MRSIYLCTLCESLLDHIALHTNFNCTKIKFALSMVAKQMTSNTVVAMRDVLQMCFVGFSSQIAMVESVALFTDCWAVQLSAMSS